MRQITVGMALRVPLPSSPIKNSTAYVPPIVYVPVPYAAVPRTQQSASTTLPEPGEDGLVDFDELPLVHVRPPAFMFQCGFLMS